MDADAMQAVGRGPGAKSALRRRFPGAVPSAGAQHVTVDQEF